MISPINEISSRTIWFLQQWTHWCCLSFSELPNKPFWHNRKITEMPRLPDYIDVAFLSPTWEVITWICHWNNFYCVIVYISFANLDLNHGFPEHAGWWDAVEHIGAGLNVVVCYSRDNAGCVSVNSAQN